MASLFGHALASIAIGNSYSKKITSAKFWLLGAFCAVIPDIDVIGFSVGIPYISMWGHRGFTHSILFALLLGALITVVFYRRIFWSKKGLLYLTFFIICTLSHGLLDAMTTGGKGVGFFIPFDATRYFFPWRPIEVSPIGIGRFFSKWGLKVLTNEFFWIGIPSLVYISISILIKKWRKNY